MGFSTKATLSIGYLNYLPIGGIYGFYVTTINIYAIYNYAKSLHYINGI